MFNSKIKELLIASINSPKVFALICQCIDLSEYVYALTEHFRDDTKCVSILLENGTDKNELLILSVRRYNDKSVKYLIENGVDVNAGGQELVIAAFNGPPSMAEILIAAGWNIHSENEMAVRTLALLCRPSSIEYLIKKGANIYDAVKFSKKEEVDFVKTYIGVAIDGIATNLIREAMR